jgi:transposase
MEDRRCKLGLAGRLQLVRLIESGCSFRAAAAQSAVSPATAHRWWHRWRVASEAERASLACLRTRSSRPCSCPWSLSAEAEQRILRARARTRYGPARLAGLVGFCRGTIYKALVRHAVSRRRAKRRRLHSSETVVTLTATLRRAAAWMTEQGCGPPEALMTDNHKAHTSDAFQALLAQLGARHILTQSSPGRWCKSVALISSVMGVGCSGRLELGVVLLFLLGVIVSSADDERGRLG